MGRHSKYSNDEERRESNLIYQRDYHRVYQKYYGSQLWRCDDCKVDVRYDYKRKHLNTKKHLKEVLTPMCNDLNIELH